MFFTDMKNTGFFILTGGPGSGKTTVLTKLAEMGYLTVEETGRKIIRNQMKICGTAVPWEDAERYARLMFLQSVMDFEQLRHIDKPCFFDRGIIVILGYSRLEKIPVTPELEEAAGKYRYNKKVFLFPFWEEIYRTDAERRQSHGKAEDTFHMMKAVYQEYGYQAVTVPCLSPEERAEWIIEEIR